MSGDRIALKRGKQSTLAERQAVFDTVNGLAHFEGGWTVSVRGASPIVIQMPVGSGARFQGMLACVGLRARSTGLGVRMVPNAIVETLTTTSSGAFETAAEGSSKPPIYRTHAGNIEVEVYEVSV